LHVLNLSLIARIMHNLQIKKLSEDDPIRVETFWAFNECNACNCCNLMVMSEKKSRSQTVYMLTNSEDNT
jgi:hypothetical protein